MFRRLASRAILAVPRLKLIFAFAAGLRMTQHAWMAIAERLMNLMESFEYKSEQYNVCRKVLLSHLAQKPTHDDEVEAWPMTGPAPFDDDAPPPPVVAKGKKPRAAAKKTASPKEPAAENPTTAKAKRVRKKPLATLVNQDEILEK
jgi:hypothetical protein